jgi:hypothetical protein
MERAISARRHARLSRYERDALYRSAEKIVADVSDNSRQ